MDFKNFFRVYKSSSEIEDVDFKEIKQEPDGTARACEVAIAATAECKGDDPVVTLARTLSFTIGARWADKHPRSGFSSAIAICHALIDAVFSGNGPIPDLPLSAAFIMCVDAARGAEWAYDHPANV